MNKQNNWQVVLLSPWKAILEIKMLLLMPLVWIYLLSKKVSIGTRFKFYGLPKILRHKGSRIIIGNNFENRNWWFSNPLGINHPTVLCTWSSNAQIIIGNDVGISGGSIVATEKIEIGDGTLIGANCMIIDSNFHPIKSANRRYDKKNIMSASIKIGRNVFLGTGCIILKGSTIPDNSVVPAGKVVRSSY